ncbi:hypothetical protein AB0D32_13715 [Micromonospora sp. NPDC048170]|uniref:hypothetical protein n=1 Tax=Micromonospora sp. NPDC048170 TaxID=3154819 RepID=UPI0033FDB5CF
MTRSRSNPRTSDRRRRPYLRLLAAVTAVLTVAGTSSATAAQSRPGPSLAPAGASAATAGSGAAPAAAGDGLRAVSLPGLKGSTYTVTLITGDEVTLTRDGGRYTITASPTPRADGTRPTIDVKVDTSPDPADTSIHALPSDVRALIAGGVVDQKVFDVLWMASRTASGESGSLPLTVEYGDQPGAATLNQRVAKLPGVTATATHPQTGRVDLRVELRHAADFWAEVKGRTSIGELNDYLFHGVVPKLGGDIVRIWPTDRRSAAAKPQADTGQPKYQITQIVKRTKGEPVNCGTGIFIMCAAELPGFTQVAGSAVGSGYEATSGRCLDQDPCTTWELTYQVPPGKYVAGGNARFWLDSREQHLNLMVPEFTVDGDATIRLDADAARELTVGTPRPTETFIGSRTNFRTYSNGHGGAWLSFTWYGNSRFWAIPSAPVTVGTFHMGVNWVLGKPLVTMSVTTPRRVDLNPMLPADWYKRPGHEVVRFDGRRNVAVVDGGLGRAADYDRVDARGKLVLLSIDADKPVGGICRIGAAQLARARAAGAVGVLIEPFSSGGIWPTTVCSLPVDPDWWYNPQEVPDIPYAAIAPGEAETLRTLLRRGQVKIEYSGYDAVSPYLYTLHIYQQGRIPASLHTEVTDKQLATVETALHGTQSQPADLVYSAFRPNETVAAGVPYRYLTDTVKFTTYRGPVSPDLVRRQDYDRTGPKPGARATDVVDRADRSTARWTAGPLVPGAPELSPKIFRSQPGKWEADWSTEVCAFCRQGNTFYPITFLVSGASPEQAMGAYVFEPDNVRMYADGREIPQTQSPWWGATYELPAESKRYRLTGRNANGTTSTTWNFTSAAGVGKTPPPGFLCAEGSATSCHAAPLVFLRYNTDADLADAVTAPGTHRLDVTAYHHAPDAPKITSVSLWISTDGGTTWTHTPTTRQGDGRYTARYRLPRMAETGGTVSIKAQAADAGGNTVEQTVLDALTLTDGR